MSTTSSKPTSGPGSAGTVISGPVPAAEAGAREEATGAVPARLTGRSLLQTLIEEPARFGFDAAVAVVMQAAKRAEPGEAVRFHAVSGLSFVSADVLAVEWTEAGLHATIGLIGLTGPSGVLPRPFTDMVNGEQRNRSPALAEFLDLLAQRSIAQFAAAGIKYRPHRAATINALRNPAAVAAPADGLRDILLALTGNGTPHLASRLIVGTEPLLFYAGHFGAWPRSADRLAALLSDWLGWKVEVQQFAGAWLALEPEQMSALPRRGRPGQFSQLGIDAAIGRRTWNAQARIIVHIGPLDLASFEAMLPDRDLLRRIAALVRAYVGFETDFAINPILAATAVPKLKISAAVAPRLGWNSWLSTTYTRRDDADDTLFKVGLIEQSGEGR